MPPRRGFLEAGIRISLEETREEDRMYIGKPQQVFIVEPLEDPVPRSVPVETTTHAGGRERETVAKPAGATTVVAPSRRARELANSAEPVNL
jgi:hypothetical protein